jgi:ubiquinone/menaquinone biosynthesis C-methylase UbiE
MSTATSPEMESLKMRLKSVWSAGDFSKVAEHIESAAEAFVDRLDIKPGMKVLDVACGSGNLAVLAAQEGADVSGIDIAPNLINAARKRAYRHALDIDFQEGDAESMPYNDAEFDLVMTMFGAMFCPRPEVTAEELLRVCKQGGTIAMANWTPDGFAGQMFKFSGKYLPPPEMPPPVQWGVPEMVERRFGDRVENLTMTLRIADMVFDFEPAAVVEFFATYFGPTVMALKAMPEENRQPYMDDMENLWTEHNIDDEGKTLVKSEYLEVIATKK